MTVAAPIATALAGFGLGAGLIVAIGAQNAFVLRQGVRREQVLAVVATCVACDWALISLGALGSGSVIARFPLVTSLAAWGGAAFLGVNGALALRSALRPGSLEAADGPGRRALTPVSAIGATLGVSLLNPHVYLDTIVLIGSIAAQYEFALRGWFAFGAGLASLAWFGALGFGARLLAPVFHKPAAWRILDLLVAGVMWWIAVTLVLGQLK